ncbi:AAA family ATPase [Nonomuraea thailandensis]
MASLASPALVGRDAPLRLLVGAITCPPAVIQVQGEAGIGKTSLVRAAIEPLTSPDRTVLIGHCHQIREPFPYGPVFDALRHVASALPGRDRLSPVTGALRGYLPELAGHLPPAPSPPPMGDPRAERHHLFRAVHALLGAAGMVVLVVEDLHWADDGTRDLLRFLTDQPPEGLALVVTFRREELPVPGLPFGHAYRRAPGVRSELISLTPLDVEGCAGWPERCSDRPPPRPSCLPRRPRLRHRAGPPRLADGERPPRSPPPSPRSCTIARRGCRS